MRTWQVRDWLNWECCGIEGAVQVFTEADNDDVCDGDTARCIEHGLSGTVFESCGVMSIRWDK